METPFKAVSVIEPSYCSSVTVYKWVSQRTGLQLVLIQRPSPCVEGDFVVATEANDNSGCPHTLEHIVFMGSQKYPYKGLLDKLGTKQLSSTNAWTAQDRTCYTLSTVGFEGFKNLLPIYLDHILNAKVEESACTTEVYHIDGKGEEKGVVFSEMQGHEHNSFSLMTTEVQKLLFNKDSGYATNTGGCLQALRTLKPETIKQYHSSMYCPANLSVVVSGDVDSNELLEIMTAFDNDLVLKPEHENHEHRRRPFIHSECTASPSPLKQTVIKEIEFPDGSDDGTGEILVSWLGPHVEDMLNITALDVVINYLEAQGAGKLFVKFVNTENAVASSLDAYYDDYLHAQININFYGIPTEKLNVAGAEIVKYLESELLELDYAFLRDCLQSTYDNFVMNAEESLSEFVNLAAIEFLYGTTKSFDERIGSTFTFDELREWTDEQWHAFIKQHFVEPPKACVIARPSQEMSKKVEEDKLKLAAQITENEDLQLREKMLKLAIEHNERPIPQEFMEMLKTPDFEKVKFIQGKSAASDKLMQSLPRNKLVLDDSVQTHIDASVDLPINFENYKSQFVTIKMYFSPVDVDKNMLPLIDAVLSNMFEFPMKLEDGVELSGEEVSKAVKRDVLVNYFSVDSQVQELVSLKMTCKAEKYVQAVEWIKRFVFNTCYDEEHINMFISKHLKSLSELKRSEYFLLETATIDAMLTPDSLRRSTNPLLNKNQVLEFQDSVNPETGKQLQSVISALFKRNLMRVLVVADVARLSVSGVNVTKPWQELAELLPSGEGFKHVPISNDFLTDLGKKPTNEAAITVCAATDSSYLTLAAAGPSYYGHKDLPALAVVNAYLQMTEGPFWTAVRGPGYAYGVMIGTDVQLGKIMLRLYSASDPISALKAVKDTLETIASGKYVIDEECIANAVSTVVNDLASYLSQPVTALNEKFLDTVVKGYAPDYVHTIISEIKKVTPEMFVKTLKEYVMPILDPKSTLAFAVVPPGDEVALEEEFIKLGYTITVSSQEESDSEESEDDA